MCFFPLVNALCADSPLYRSLTVQSPKHSTSYVMLSALQFPVPPDEHTKQPSLSQCRGLKGLDTCNLLFSVVPVFSITLIRRPLFAISFGRHVSGGSLVSMAQRGQSQSPHLCTNFSSSSPSLLHVLFVSRSSSGLQVVFLVTSSPLQFRKHSMLIWLHCI